MSALKDVLESNEFVKGVALSLIMMPFWYVSFYLFNHDFILNENYVTISCLCFVFSITATYLGGSCKHDSGF